MSLDEPGTMPLVSICMPTYNGEAFLEEALQSIRQQDYKNIELIISDDQSSDKTISIIQNFKLGVDFPVKIITHNPNGIGSNWNNCIKNAIGSYVKFLFQDDVLLKTCVTDLVNALEHSDSNVMFSYCKKELIGDFSSERQMNENKIFEKYACLDSLEILGHKDLYSQPRNKIGEPICILFRKEVFNEVGLFDERLQQSLDYEYLYRVMSEFELIAVPKVLVKFRVHQNQASFLNNKKVVIDSYLLPRSLLSYANKLHIKTRLILLYKYISGSIMYFIVRKFSAK